MNGNFELGVGVMIVVSVSSVIVFSVYSAWKAMRKAKTLCDTPSDDTIAFHKSMILTQEMLKQKHNNLLIKIAELEALDDGTYSANAKICDLLDECDEYEKLLAQTRVTLDNYEASYPIFKEKDYVANPAILLEDK